MMKDARINIKGSSGDEDVIELDTVGRFGIKDGSFLITYDESEMLGMGKVKTTLYVKDDGSVILQRTGELESRLVIEQGRRSLCRYNTPEGELLIGIFGETVETDLTDNGGNIALKYTIDSNLELVSHNTVNISVREVK